jgi:hypothetical protein
VRQIVLTRFAPGTLDTITRRLTYGFLQPDDALLGIVAEVADSVGGVRIGFGSACESRRNPQAVEENASLTVADATFSEAVKHLVHSDLHAGRVFDRRKQYGSGRRYGDTEPSRGSVVVAKGRSAEGCCPALASARKDMSTFFVHQDS